MAKPIAYFGYSKSGLTVSFINTSLNSPVSYDWDFGDGSTSNEKNPSHEYSGMGFFTVRLVCTNTDGDSEPLVMNIGVGQNNDMLDTTVVELIDHYMPSALMGEINAPEKIALIQKWQLYLQPLVVIPQEILPEDTHNEFAWPGLVNSLIAQLVSYDIILQGANQFISASGTAGGTELDTDTGTVETNAQIKSIETGPAKTEWYQNETSTSSSENIKNIGAAFASATKAGGALDQLKNAICQQAARLRIYLPMCGQLSGNTTPPSIVKHKHCGGNNANPFGITKRMI